MYKLSRKIALFFVIVVIFILNLIIVSTNLYNQEDLDTTEKASGTKPLWSFVVIGDTCGDDREMMDKLAQSVVSEAKPDLLIHVGDLCYRKYNPYSGNKIEQIQYWKKNYGISSQTIPMHLCVGNHDHPSSEFPGLIKYELRRMLCTGEEIVNPDQCVRNLSTCQIKKRDPWNTVIQTVPGYCNNIKDPYYNSGSLQYSFLKGGIKFVILNDKWFCNNGKIEGECTQYFKEAMHLINEDKGETLTLVFTQNPVLPNYYAYYFDTMRIPIFYNYYRNYIKNSNFKLIFAGDAHKFLYSIVNFKNNSTFEESKERKGKPYNFPNMQNYTYQEGEIHQLVTAGWAWGARDDGVKQRDYFWVKVYSDRLEVYRKVYDYPKGSDVGHLLQGFEKILTIPGKFYADSTTIDVKIYIDGILPEDKDKLTVKLNDVILKNVKPTSYWVGTVKILHNQDLKMQLYLPKGYICKNCQTVFNSSKYIDKGQFEYTIKIEKLAESTSCFYNGTVYEVGEVFEMNGKVCECQSDASVYCYNSTTSTPTPTPTNVINQDSDSSSSNLNDQGNHNPGSSVTTTPTSLIQDKGNNSGKSTQNVNASPTPTRPFIELGEQGREEPSVTVSPVSTDIPDINMPTITGSYTVTTTITQEVNFDTTDRIIKTASTDKVGLIYVVGGVFITGLTGYIIIKYVVLKKGTSTL